jgi:hypothetical protein
MVRYGLPSLSGLSFGPETPPPFFSWQTPPPPPPPALEMVIRQSDRTVSLVYLAVWAEDGQAIPKSVYFEL